MTGATWRQLPDDAPEPERGAVVLDRDHDQWRRCEDGRWRLNTRGGIRGGIGGGFDWHDDVSSHRPLMIAIAGDWPDDYEIRCTALEAAATIVARFTSSGSRSPSDLIDYATSVETYLRGGA